MHTGKIPIEITLSVEKNPLKSECKAWDLHLHINTSVVEMITSFTSGPCLQGWSTGHPSFFTQNSHCTSLSQVALLSIFIQAVISQPLTLPWEFSFLKNHAEATTVTRGKRILLYHLPHTILPFIFLPFQKHLTIILQLLLIKLFHPICLGKSSTSRG